MSKELIVSHPDKILFPKDNITKLMIIEYYYKIAEKMFFLTKNHLLTMQRFPEGITKEGFWHKNCPEYFPKWIKRFNTKKEDGQDISYAVINNLKIFAFVANYYSITNHISLSTSLKPTSPDRIVFDLDPSLNNDFSKVQEVALLINKILDKKNIISFVMTTGSRGLHIVVPIKQIYSNKEIKLFAEKIALEASLELPEKITLNIRKEKREDKVFIDTLRNNHGQTVVAPYSLRAKDGAPVATPILWKEAGLKELTPTKYNIYNVFEQSKENSWENFSKTANKLIID